MILDVEDLSIGFNINGNLTPVTTDISFSIDKGEILALVGESGCGKSVTCMALAKLLPESQVTYINGSVKFYDNDNVIDIFNLSKKDLRKVRGGKIAYIFQEPSVSMNPVFTIGNQIAEAVALHQPNVINIEEEVVSLLTQVGIPEPRGRINNYPHEMSGGMLQRVMIAMALASKPDLLVADEPTTALDVTIQAQVLELLCDIREQNNMSILLITHNLGIVSEVADRVVVMYAGNTVESAPVENVIHSPLHPYTKALIDAIPKLNNKIDVLTTIQGQVPSPENYPKGCRFCERCKLYLELSDTKQNLCKTMVPEWKSHTDEHFVRCYGI